MSMGKRVWASLDDYLPPSAGPSRVGRNMANHYFFRALLRHGTFDEYHFFLSNAAHRKLFLQNHEPLLVSLGVQKRVKIFDRTALPGAVADTENIVFHQSDHVTLFNALCRVRNSLGLEFPVTSFIHSISYQEFMGRYLEMLSCGAGSSDAVICSSECGKTVIDKCFARITSGLNLSPEEPRRVVIPLGIDETGPMPDRAAARKSLGLPDDEVIALCFGRFSEFDKMDLFPLLQAFRDAGASQKPWRLVLAGALHSENYLKIIHLWARAQGVLDKVTFVADPTEEQKQLLYSASDFFVSISDNPQETFGLTILEALRAGLPCVVSDFDGYKELASDDVALRIPTTWCRLPELSALGPIMDERTFHQYVSQTLDVSLPELTAALSRMFSEHALRGEMSRRATKRFTENYAHHLTIAALERLWTELKEGFRAAPPRPDPLNLDVFETFSHYVTRFANSHRAVRRTPLGQRLLGSGGSYPLLSGMPEMIDNDAVRQVLTATDAPKKIEELRRAGKPAWRETFLLMWMLKHGLIEEAPED